LRVQIESESDEIDVTSALAVAEQSTLDTLGTGHLSKLGRSNSTATVVVRMEGDNELLTLGHISAEILNLIGVDIGSGHLDGSRQIENNGVLNSRLPSSLDSLANLHSEFRLGIRESFRGELKLPLRTSHGGVILCN
jgi:hypothetical protein